MALTVLSFNSRAIFLPFLCVHQDTVIYRTNNGLAISFQTVTAAWNKSLCLEDFPTQRPCSLSAGYLVDF